MSGCNNFNTRDQYDENMFKSHHSPVWHMNEHTRSQYDLDMRQAYMTGSNRFLPKEQPQYNRRQVEHNVHEAYAPLTGIRTEFDRNMQKTYVTGKNIFLPKEQPQYNPRQVGHNVH